MTLQTVDVDMAVIGAGTAGMHAFSTAQRAGARVLMIDGGPLGTTCARVGCMPSKAVLHAAKRWSTLRGLVDPEGLAHAHTTPQQLWSQALSIRDELVTGNVRQTQKLGGDALWMGRARFTGPHSLALDDGRTVRARAFVVATGSQAVKPPELRRKLGAALITTDELFSMERLPASVAILGLGAIGLEMGVALSRLGVRVAAAGRSPVLAKIADPQVAEAAQRYFSQHLSLVLGERSIRTQACDGGVRLQAGAIDHRADYLLAALGRVPDWEGLELQATGAQFDAQGRVLMEGDRLQCAGTAVFVAGDAAPGAALMHEAGHEGALAAQQALRWLGDARWHSLPQRHRTVPMAIVFSDPDIAEVGLRFDQLPADALVATVQGSGSGRSKLMQAPHHVLRLYAERPSGRLLGASLLCAEGEHLAHALAWAVQRGDTVDDLLAMPYYHPTLEEMIDTALRDLRRGLRKA